MVNLKLLLTLLTLSVCSQIYTIDLDEAPSRRYSELTLYKKDSILNFINYLKMSVPKFNYAFRIARVMSAKAPKWFKHKVGTQFYQECKSISTVLGIPVSDIVVFNYMYELGAAHKFCTAIAVSSKNQTLLGRNLDYGFQQYLANNSIHIQYKSKGKVLFETLGHAGLIGTHTALKRATVDDPHQYAITLNQRIVGGLRLTLAQIFTTKCYPSPSAIIHTLKNCKGNIEKVVQYISKINTCSPVYYTIIGQNGQSYVIEKNRGKSSHLIRRPENFEGISYLVQTNHDANVQDPDGRSKAATQKLTETINKNSQVTSNDIWKILLQSPNFNSLTLMSAVIDVKNGHIDHKIWNMPQQ